MKQNEPKKIAREHFEKAYKLQIAGNLPDAIEYYRLSIELHPTAEAHTFLGWAYSHQGQYEEAIEECLKAIKVDPDFGNPYNDIGAYLIEKGKYRESVPWLQKAIQAKRYDSYYYPHYNLGRVYEHEATWRKALTCYEEAIKVNPDYILAVKARNRLRALFN